MAYLIYIIFNFFKNIFSIFCFNFIEKNNTPATTPTPTLTPAPAPASAPAPAPAPTPTSSRRFTETLLILSPVQLSMLIA